MSIIYTAFEVDSLEHFKLMLRGRGSSTLRLLSPRDAVLNSSLFMAC